MRMCMILVSGLPISLAKVVSGQIGMQFRPSQEGQVDVWEDISSALTEKERLACADRSGDGSMTYVTNFASFEEAIGFLKSAEFKVAVVTRDEFALVPKLAS